MIRENQDYLYDYVFHYNPDTGLWALIPRDEFDLYWAGEGQFVMATHLNDLYEHLAILHDINKQN